MRKTSVASPSVRLGKAELVVTALILGGAAASTMAALPVFRFGVWRDGEPTVIAVFALGAMAWLWGGYLYSRHNLANTPLTVTACLLFAVWCSFTSLFAPFPILSFLGSPQLGEGPALFFCLSGLMLLIWSSRQRRLAMRAPLISAIFMILYAAVANRLSEDSDFSLFGFEDYVGVFAILLPALLYCLSKEFALPPRGCHVVVLIGYGLAVLLSLDGNNQGAAMALVLSASIWAVMTLLFARGKLLWQRVAIWGAMVAVVMIPLCIMVGLWALGQNIDIHQEASLPELYPRLYSMVSRALMLKLTAYAFGDGGPWTYLLGNGFGHSLFYIQNYLPFSGQSFLYPNWDVFYRDFVHTHSIPYEVLLSGGIIALALYLIVFVLWIYEAAAEHRAIVIATALGYMVVISIWFEFASFIPLLALVIGATLQNSDDPGRRWGLLVWPRGAWMGGVLIGFVLSGSAVWLYWQNRGLDRTVFMASAKPLNSLALPDDGARGDISLQRALLDGCRPLAGQDSNDVISISAAQIEWCNGLLLQARREIDSHPNSALVLAYLVLADEFANSAADAPPVSRDIQKVLSDNWGDVAEHLIVVAPHRVDVLVTYFSYLADADVPEGTRQQGVRILSAFARQYPENPIVLWFNGQQKLNDQSRQHVFDGLTEMIDSIEKHHLERYIGLPDDMLAKLKKVRAELAVGG
ncbi:hypothetical protein [Thalassospira lohafexi]|uniref:Ligase n=1 Tax=Thalassospira lohafexi TaxID=744227 RepID=A0A2N3L6U2_9PROT|nr:hypothetical protein [Thalassospira lohafexi]PKR58535.1 hypothetical protein COO92_12475 [Thalassospira lohafexi]